MEITNESDYNQAIAKVDTLNGERQPKRFPNRNRNHTCNCDFHPSLRTREV